MVPHKYLKNGTMEGLGDRVTRVTFNFVFLKQIQLRINMAQEYGG